MTSELSKDELAKILKNKVDVHAILVSPEQADFKSRLRRFVGQAERNRSPAMILVAVNLN